MWFWLFKGNFDGEGLLGLDDEGQLLGLQFLWLFAFGFAGPEFPDFVSGGQVDVGAFEAENSSLSVHVLYILFAYSYIHHRKRIIVVVESKEEIRRSNVNV